MRLVLAVLLLCSLSVAQTTINIWPGTAPGSEKWTQKERIETNTPIGAVVFNVVTPTLTAYLPEKSQATGTGVLFRHYGFEEGYAEVDLAYTAQTWAMIMDRLAGYAASGSPQPFFPAVMS